VERKEAILRYGTEETMQKNGGYKKEAFPRLHFSFSMADGRYGRIWRVLFKTGWIEGILVV
jgi:hypothetical protein